MYIHTSTNTFDVYLNGACVASGLTMLGSGNVDRLRFQDGACTGNTIWFDDVRVYTSLTVTVQGLSSGYTVKLVALNGTVLATSTNGVLTMPHPEMNVPPATIVITSKSGTVYSSAVMDVWGGDIYTFNEGLNSSDQFSFYSNNVKSYLHDLVAGTLTYENYGSTATTEETYVQYNNEGNPITTKAKLGSGWVCTQSSYDQYGNLLSYIDGSGNLTTYSYTSSTGYTYPSSVSSGGQNENFETVGTWLSSSSCSWMLAQYSTTESYSPSHSVQLSFSGALNNGQDHGTATMSNYYNVSMISSVSLKMYVGAYSHNDNSSDQLSSGIELQLYNSNGVNYANCSYWLACWYQTTNNQTSSSPYVKVIYGEPKLNTWVSLNLTPTSDFTTINWAQCTRIGVVLFENVAGAYGDQFSIYFDDLEINQCMQYAYDLQTGNVLSETDPCGLTTSYEYDLLGRVTRTNESDGSNTTTFYDDKHNTMTTYDEMGRKTVYYYNELGMNTKIVTYGLSSTPYSNVSYTYNWQGNVATYTDAMGRVTMCSYDYLGRLIATQYFDGTNTTLNVSDNFESGNNWSPTASASWLYAQYDTCAVLLGDTLGTDGLRQRSDVIRQRRSVVQQGIQRIVPYRAYRSRWTF